jgi:hypothetical protein
MLRNLDELRGHARTIFLHSIETGNLDEVIEERFTFFGNVEMSQDYMHKVISEELSALNCILVKPVMAIHDDDGSRGWTKVFIQFIHRPRLPYYLEGLERDHAQEKRNLKVEIQKLQHELDGYFDLRPEN